MIRLRSALLLLLPVLLMANKCREAAGGTANASLLDTKWFIQTLNGKAFELPEGVERPWLQLAGEQVSGFNGCNQVMGAFKLDAKDGRIGFPDLASTRKYCEPTADLEKGLMSALGKVDSYEMKDGTLRLLSSGKELLTLKQ
ncbi:MAG: META domain-containing protein [Flavobacteriales bacterium]|nr:META domain-containing protein [Flavobacteriales bacterium]